jgi:hypothetical protein
MLKIARTAAFAAGMLTAAVATAHAQSYYYPGTTYQSYPSYSYAYPGYSYAYPSYGYNYPYSYPAYGYYYSGWPTYGYPTYGSYMGQAYPTPKAYWDPYVASRPYSDNAGPKASGHGGF